MLISSTLKDRVIVISGGTGYLGSSIAKVFSENGAKVVILYKTTNEERVKGFISSLSGMNNKAYYCDLRNQEEVSLVIEKIEKDFGKIDICIHTAGEKPLRKKLCVTTDREMKEQFENTTISGFNFITSCAKKMKDTDGGIIIGITTAGVIIKEATPSLGAYIPAKYALQGVLVMLSEELKNNNVKVYSVAPGFMEGGMNNDIPKAFIEMIRNKSKSKKITNGGEIADKILDICINQEKYRDMVTVTIAPEYE